jgi:uncharacterized membrane protein YedE/YeeE
MKFRMGRGVLVMLPLVFCLMLLDARLGHRTTAIAATGILLGMVLMATRFSFSAAFAGWLGGERRTLAAHAVMLLVGSLAFALLLQAKPDLKPNVYPLGAGVAVGAFLFGLGMQLAAACASSSLYLTGSGSLNAVLVLVAFMAGTLPGEAHRLAFWNRMTSPPFSLLEHWGWPGVAGQCILLAGVAWLAVRHQKIDRPLWLAACLLGVLNGLVLLLSGKPWGVSTAIAGWAYEVAHSLGWSVGPVSKGVAHMAEVGLVRHPASLLNGAVVVGAMAWSLGQGNWRLRFDGRPLTLVGQLIGGLLMGYGSRIVPGCNIGAYFSGIASFSLHGWLWLALALCGSAAGLRLKPWFA